MFNGHTNKAINHLEKLQSRKLLCNVHWSNLMITMDHMPCMIMFAMFAVPAMDAGISKAAPPAAEPRMEPRGRPSGTPRARGPRALPLLRTHPQRALAMAASAPASGVPAHSRISGSYGPGPGPLAPPAQRRASPHSRAPGPQAGVLGASGAGCECTVALQCCTRHLTRYSTRVQLATGHQGNDIIIKT